MTALITYIDAWVANDAERITNAVNSDCVIIECYGPRYVGRERVKQWAETWLDGGGIVHQWEVHDHIVTGDREVATWTFECTWQGVRSSFDGVTVARVCNGRITELREYQTNGDIYDWTGTWR
jgi:ketosteroid isomerase-like protein